MCTVFCDFVFEAKLVRQLAALLGRISTTNHSRLAIKVACNLLERGVAGLDVEHVDDDELDGEPDAVDDVVLPADVADGDGVDVLVEENWVIECQRLIDAFYVGEKPTRKVDAKENDRHALGADVVRQNLDCVTNQEARPSQVVEDVVDEYHGNHSVRSRFVALDGELRGADSPDDEGAQHASGRDEEKLPTSNFVDEETHGQRHGEVDNLQDPVDKLLRRAIRDTDGVEHLVEVIGYETVARPLRKEACSDKNDEPVAVALSLDELRPGVAFEFLLEFECVADFLHFELHDFVLSIAISVALSERVQGFLIATLGNVETR